MVTIKTLQRELPRLCQKHKIAYVDAFGSIARDEGDEKSDIDLIIEFEEPRLEAISQRYFGFLHDMEDTFHCKVDLLTQKSLKNPYLIESINKDRVRIYGSQNL